MDLSVLGAPCHLSNIPIWFDIKGWLSIFVFIACLIFCFVILLPVVLVHTYTPPDGYKLCLYLGKCLIKVRMVMCVCVVVTLIYSLSVHN